MTCHINNMRTQSLFLCFHWPESLSSVTVILTVSNSARSEMNEENLLCPPGQRLEQKSGSQLNPLPSPCQSCPVPFHSTRGLVEIRGWFFPCARCQKSAWRENDAPKKQASNCKCVVLPSPGQSKTNILPCFQP